MDQFPKDSFVPQPSDATAQRGKPRDSLFLVAEVRIDGRLESSQVRVRNLSSGGLMADYPHPVDIGTAVEVELRGIGKINGEIAWTAAGRIGVSFEHPIDPMQARKPVGVPKSAPTKDRPIKPIL
ncbi:PilZ domain-containing protein [Sphingomonas sp.]|jgi:hypothetical protein|uniref:PilZ domain-containing protein n=1 Tax=Sphingomonas sp. TaxID=28214 RepID=UPI002E30F0C5|nr:PilZ domain-containing protein [Sphingomonas sp.]HEX4693797.1 PilZ domain-containing protein [Sphingomonas sp.]